MNLNLKFLKNLNYSLEFFPPKTTEGLEKLKSEILRLRVINPEYISVTYGAGGSTRERTCETVRWLCTQGWETAPHLTCIGSTREQVRNILTQYQALGIRRLVALRGDIPSGMGGSWEEGDFRYAAELVSFIRAEFNNFFRIEIAAYPEYHPQATNPDRDLEYFKRKIDAGANGAITQYFYNPDAYFGFVKRCQQIGITVPITPGIMPITNYTQLARFSDTCGAEIPRWIRKRLESYSNDLASLRAFGHEIVLQLCQRLLDEGAPGLHFYTMNQADSILNLWQDLIKPN